MRTITGTVLTVDGLPVASTEVSFTLVNNKVLPTSSFDATTHERVYGTKTATTDALGVFSISLWENTKLVDESYYLVEVAITDDVPFMAALVGGVGSVNWLEFKVAGQIVTPAQLLILDSLINRAELAASGAEASATTSQLKVWEAEARQMTADSYATEAVDTLVKTYTSNGDGTYIAADTAEYSSLHYKMKSGESAASSEALLNDFDTRYLGAKTIVPTLDNLGNPLLVSALYFDTPSGTLKVWDGTVWAAFNGDISYSLLQPGQIGFGIAPAKKEKYEAIGAVPFEGHNQINSTNRGKYLHIASGATAFYVPKHYYKETVNEVLFSDYSQPGYVLDRSFINGGLELDGVFIFGYGGSNNGGKLSARKGFDPVSTAAAHNPISALSTAPANNYGGMYKAAKSCDAKAFPTPIWQWRMLARLAIAHGKASASTAVCAFKDVAPFHPKGNNNNALKDANDTSVTFAASGYSNCALTGSGIPFAKTTHNGQECGIADLNGNMWEVVSGLTYRARTGATGTTGTTAIALTAHGYIVGDKISFGGTPTDGSTYNTVVYTVATVVDANNFTIDVALARNILATDGIYTGKTFYMLKESVDITALLDDSETLGTGAFDMSLYDAVDLSALIPSNLASTRLGNGANQVFEFSTDRNSAAYKRSSLGIPTVLGSSAGGTTEFGQDEIYRYLRHNCVLITGGDWINSANAGVGSLYLNSYRTTSYDNVGLRCSFNG